MSEIDFIDMLERKGLVIISMDVLEQKLINVNAKTLADKRVKWITAKEAIAKYGVTMYWLQKNEVGTLLRVSKGKGKTSTKKYLEQSIIDQQKAEACQ